ncbi:uncharacterized protein N7446_000662 [Penicillium canescens]|uniref:Uncharacterized protein n=1 Tax=Penicillium canescens TaxID=5083 RepID=A0AAD6I4Q5_PENCN|nr:uncharacterized protein N7446_000662 [Penicillium canescens]KAJ6030276.1 hypothetical protein N7460_010542 [Penicillium canescens]KAJ6060651.1 hypothetical protein N7444_002505 [Penicillium canescens]KAJ6077726.1 hypothetical protein N7446_000662 [Penicillium canescens]
MSNLSDLERAALRAMKLTDEYSWYDVLRKRFKVAHNNALHALNNTEIIRVCDALETPYPPRDRMDCIERNLDAAMRLNVAVPTSTTVLSDWLQKEQLENRQRAFTSRGCQLQSTSRQVQSQLSHQPGSRDLPIHQNDHRSHGAHERYESRKVAAFRAAKSPTSS